MPLEDRPAASFVTTSAVIRATAYIVPARHDPARDPYYQIVTGPDHDPGAPELIFLTRDPVLYAQAVALEGTERRILVQWHPGQAARTSRVVRILEAFR
jgi:hypothetical protein